MNINTTQDETRFSKRPTPIAWLVLAPLLLWLIAFVIAPTFCMILASFAQRDNLGRIVYLPPDQEHGGIFANYIAVFSRLEIGIQAAVIVASAIVAAVAYFAFRHQRTIVAIIAILLPLAALDYLLFLMLDGWMSRIILELIFLAIGLALVMTADDWISLPARNPFSSMLLVFTACWWIGSNVVYLRDFAEVLYLKTLVLSVNYAGLSTVICVVAGYPVAYFIGKAPERWRNILLMLVMIPFWTSFLVRTYAWVSIFRSEGVLNSILGFAGDRMVKLHLITQTPEWMHLDLYPSQFAVMVGLIYTYLPFMILPIYGSVEKLDNALVEAAFDLGASPLRAFSRVIFPLTQPGIVAGILLVFVPAVGMFAINDILGGHNEMLIGNVIEQQFRAARNQPFGAALGMVLLLTFVLIYYFSTRRRGGAVG